MVRKSKVLIPALLSLAMGACSDRPSHEKFPGGQGRTTDIQQAATQGAVMGGFDPMRNPLVGGSKSDANAAATGPTIAGRIEAPAGLETQGKILFIFVRSGMGGPPLAVKRIESPILPLPFTLSGADRMAEHTVFEGDVTLHARLDSDGNAMTTTKEDFVAEVPTKVGASGLVLTLKANQ